MDGTVFVAGQIGMQPSDLAIIPGGSRAEARLSLRHVSRVISAIQPNSNLNQITLTICYVTRVEYIEKAEHEWERALQCTENIVSCCLSFEMVSAK